MNPSQPANWQTVALIRLSFETLKNELAVSFAPATSLEKTEQEVCLCSSDYRLGTYSFYFRAPSTQSELGIEVLLDLADPFNGRDNSLFRLFRKLNLTTEQVIWVQIGYLPREYAS